MSLYKSLRQLKFVDSNLRCHQFVKEGAEEVLESRPLTPVLMDFGVHDFEDFNYVELLGYRLALERGIYRNSLYIE